MRLEEYILCAAIRRITPREHNCNYHSNDIPLIELGYRHHDILIRFRGEVSTTPSDQGFYTSNGRFVDRFEAYDIAKAAGQLTDDQCKEKEYRSQGGFIKSNCSYINNTPLYSEDLY